MPRTLSYLIILFLALLSYFSYELWTYKSWEDEFVFEDKERKEIHSMDKMIKDPSVLNGVAQMGKLMELREEQKNPSQKVNEDLGKWSNEEKKWLEDQNADPIEKADLTDEQDPEPMPQVQRDFKSINVSKRQFKPPSSLSYAQSILPKAKSLDRNKIRLEEKQKLIQGIRDLYKKSAKSGQKIQAPDLEITP